MTLSIDMLRQEMLGARLNHVKVSKLITNIGRQWVCPYDIPKPRNRKERFGGCLENGREGYVEQEGVYSTEPAYQEEDCIIVRM